MCELSAGDGFVEINENLGDMMKYVANEPSVGLYYIQQHAQNAVPNIIRLKNNVSEKSDEVSLHTEDLEDSISMTRTMKRFGSPVIDEMIRDIRKSLTLMSNKQPVRGVIQQRSPGYQIGISSSWGPVTWARSAVNSPKDSEKSSSYFSSVFKSTKDKAGNFKWPQGPQIDVKEPLPSASNASSQADEIDELPISSHVEDEEVEDGNLSVDGEYQPIVPQEREFDEFKAVKNAGLEKWLEGSGSILQNESNVDKGYGHHLLDSL